MPEVPDTQPPSSVAYRRIKNAAQNYFSGKKEGARIFLALHRDGVFIEATMASLSANHIVSWIELEDCVIDPIEAAIKFTVARIQHTLYAKVV